MMTEIESLAHASKAYYLSDVEEPHWVTDGEGELVFFAMVQDGEVKEWVWL